MILREIINNNIKLKCHVCQKDMEFVNFFQNDLFKCSYNATIYPNAFSHKHDKISLHANGEEQYSLWYFKIINGSLDPVLFLHARYFSPSSSKNSTTLAKSENNEIVVYNFYYEPIIENNIIQVDTMVSKLLNLKAFI